MILKIYQKSPDEEIYKLVGGGEYYGINSVEAFARRIDITQEPGFIGRSLSDSDIIEVKHSNGSAFYRYDGTSFQQTDFDVAKANSDDAMKCVYVAPGELARMLVIGKRLSPLQNAVNGYIEVFYPFEDDVGVICNGNGKLEQLAPNRAFRDESGNIYDIVAGSFIIAGLSGDDFCSLSDEKLEQYKADYLQPERFINIDNNIISYKYYPAQGLHL